MADLLVLVRKYGDARAAKALHYGDAQRVSCDCALGAVEDAVAALRAEVARLRREVEAWRVWYDPSVTTDEDDDRLLANVVSARAANEAADREPQP